MTQATASVLEVSPLLAKNTIIDAVHVLQA